MLNQWELPCVLMLKQGEAGCLNAGAVKTLAVGLELSGEETGDLLAAGSGAIRIYSNGGTDLEALSLTAECYTDARPAPIQLSVPWDAIGRGKHSLLWQYGGHFVRLYVDGVLVDEDWPMGSIMLDGNLQVHPDVVSTRIWYDIAESVMTDPDLEERYLGREPESIQYWKPKGFNTGVGDCMPYFDGEQYRIYYLYDRRGHASKWGLGAHQWAQLSTKDLKSWEQHPMAVAITEEWEGSICTGSVYRKDERSYYAFYAVRAVDGSPARLTYAVSEDGISFTKTGISIGLSDRYTLPSVRDPHVFQSEDGKYHMLITTSLVDSNKHKGCLAHLESDDLENWTELEPFIVPGYHDEPECSDCFEWNGWYYLIFSNDGTARYRYARDLNGPWLRPAMDVFDGPQWRVPKTAAFPGGRRIAAGFLSSPGKYGGELILRELVQHPGGALGFRFVPELLEQATSTTDIPDTYLLEGGSGRADQAAGHPSPSYRLSFQAKPEDLTMYFGFSIADSSTYQSGYDIRFEPSRRKVGVHRIHASTLQEDELSSIYDVDGLDQPVLVEAVIKPGWIDLCVNGNRTLITRIDMPCGHLSFFAQFGTAEFASIRMERTEDLSDGRGQDD
ncbi:glycosyl hydrolase [Paenibacillus glycanilyticus]|uniref:glycosyl hydrolase n=1 Tax=Paenibacillus glycanilyticus TaxID=126569 RepID=UPI002041FEC9|nr:glycosyl hydrolase [Paenibacillus glycanilyticus]MCM3626928.1 glycosyl hydrolase [Paenibacillus glycanilyticus]